MTRRTLLTWVVITVIAACALRVALVVVYPMKPLDEMLQDEHGDEPFYFEAAQALVDTGIYSEGHLRAYRPPGYPSFLAAHLATFGRSTRAVQITQNLMFLLAVGLLSIAVGREIGPGVAIATAWVLLLDPPWAIHAQKAYSETLYVFVMVAGLLVALLARSKGRWWLALSAGLIFGLSALVREIGMLTGLLVAFILLTAQWRTQGFRSGVRLAIPMVAGVALAILPWTLRNWSVLGSPVPITTNGPINLYLGNNPTGPATGFDWKLPPGMQEIWNTTIPGAELTVSRTCGREAVRYILDNPGATASIWPQKFRSMWFPAPIIASKSGADHAYRILRWAYWPPFALLACYGIWLSRRMLLTWIVLLICLMAGIIHLLTVGSTIYRLPLEMLLAIPVGVALTHLAKTFVAAFGSRPTERLVDEPDAQWGEDGAEPSRENVA